MKITSKNKMPTCGFIRVQPDGMKIKNANSAKKWDPVSRRMIDICLPPPPPPPPPPAVITSVILTRYDIDPGIRDYISFTVSWTISESAPVVVKLYFAELYNLETYYELSSTQVSADVTSITDIVVTDSGDYYAVITPVEGVGVSSNVQSLF